MIDEYNMLKKKIIEFFSKFKDQCAAFFAYLAKNIDKMIKESPEKLNQLL